MKKYKVLKTGVIMGGVAVASTFSTIAIVQHTKKDSKTALNLNGNFKYNKAKDVNIADSIQEQNFFAAKDYLENYKTELSPAKLNFLLEPNLKKAWDKVKVLKNIDFKKFIEENNKFAKKYFGIDVAKFNKFKRDSDNQFISEFYIDFKYNGINWGPVQRRYDIRIVVVTNGATKTERATDFRRLNFDAAKIRKSKDYLPTKSELEKLQVELFDKLQKDIKNAKKGHDFLEVIGSHMFLEDLIDIKTNKLLQKEMHEKMSFLFLTWGLNTNQGAWASRAGNALGKFDPEYRISFADKLEGKADLSKENLGKEYGFKYLTISVYIPSINEVKTTTVKVQYHKLWKQVNDERYELKKQA